MAEQRVPEATSDYAEAMRLVKRDGAAILHNIDTSEAGAGRLMAELLGDSLQALPPPARVFDGGEQDQKLIGINNLDPLPVHTDGFSYGDAYPDYLLLICVVASEQGGENFLVDGYSVLEDLRNNNEQAWVADALMNTVVDQTEPGMQESISPIVQTNRQGRLMVRRTFDQDGGDPKPWQGSQDKERDKNMIRLWGEAIDQSAETAPRFKLGPGDAILVDNYRMFHGRTGYSDLNRMMWRVWGWSDQALKIPEGQLHSDSRYAWREA